MKKIKDFYFGIWNRSVPLAIISTLTVLSLFFYFQTLLITHISGEPFSESNWNAGIVSVEFLAIFTSIVIWNIKQDKK